MLLLMTVPWTCLFVVTILATCISDVVHRRIPNAMMLTVMASGYLYWGSRFGLSGVIFASEGAALGLLALLGFYCVGWVGAGDVKILAAFGAILGPNGVVHASLLGLMLGGLLSLVYLQGRTLMWQLIPQGGALHSARATGQTIPLASALAVGALLTQMGFAL